MKRPMPRLRVFLVLVAAFVGMTYSVNAAGGKIIKTLPHFLDEKGRHTIRPSLLERDAYQADLKKHPERCSGMRFDVQWKARQLTGNHSRLRLEVKGANLRPREIETFEQEIKRGGLFSKWTGVTVAGEDFKRIGAVRAWRVTLWDGETLLAEQKSFLW